MSESAFGAHGPQQSVPVCRNHADRPTYVRCQRCDQPICSECTRQAAVGVQCPQCVNAGKKSVRTPRTVAGAEIGNTKPVVTYGIIGVSVVAFAAQMLLGWESFTQYFVFSPFLGLDEPWRFVTAALLHSTGWLLHIAFNMWALWVVGSQLELILGRARFITLYVLSAIGGHVAVLLLASPLSDSWAVGTLGASGAVFGLFGALVPVIRRVGGDLRGITGLIAINVVLGFVIPNISWQGHLGGLVTGLALSALYVRAPRDKKGLVAVVGSVLVAVVLIGAALGKYAAVGYL